MKIIELKPGDKIRLTVTPSAYNRYFDVVVPNMWCRMKDNSFVVYTWINRRGTIFRISVPVNKSSFDIGDFLTTEKIIESYKVTINDCGIDFIDYKII